MMTRMMMVSFDFLLILYFIRLIAHVGCNWLYFTFPDDEEEDDDDEE